MELPGTPAKIVDAGCGVRYGAVKGTQMAFVTLHTAAVAAVCAEACCACCGADCGCDADAYRLCRAGWCAGVFDLHGILQGPKYRQGPLRYQCACACDAMSGADVGCGGSRDSGWTWTFFGTTAPKSATRFAYELLDLPTNAL
eukprot:229971-Rhodomonas_salina.6